VASEDAVQRTHVDAALAKMRCSQLGYFDDKFAEVLVRSSQPPPRSPLIHRGYYSRVSAIRSTVLRFLQGCPPGKGVQIVNLGAGLDTLFFWLRDSPDRWRNDLVYFEVDFAEVLSKKLSTILKKQSLWPLLGAKTADDLVSKDLSLSGTRDLHTHHCRFVSADMRFKQELEEATNRAGLSKDMPTLFIAECVLVYMQALHGDGIIEWAASAVPNAPSAMVVYEQTNPNDPFGKVMVDNLMQRGCPLLSVFDYPSLDAQRDRYRKLGWEKCVLADMNKVYKEYLDSKDVERIHKLELMDEFEEWHLIQAHYFVLVASRAPQKSVTQESETPADENIPEDAMRWVHGLVPEFEGAPPETMNPATEATA